MFPPKTLCLFAALLASAPAADLPILEIEEVLADGKAVAFSPERSLELPAGRHDLEFRFRTGGTMPPGRMRFQAIGCGSGGVWLGAMLLGTGVWQAARRRYRRRIERLEMQAVLEKDRMHIARDIHDDVGAQQAQDDLRLARGRPAAG